ncbi:MAG: HoxN/HupN/NixA family nickel/cobalt transporter [Gammaproteobacteria bacterium]|nr:HoxN/HupN/NixA family nickel/cobalt transporter [Gammaproteobacteria bacterium]
MLGQLRRFLKTDASMRNRVFGILTLLVAFNVVAWAWALIVFHGNPVLLGTAVLAYSFGMRHAFDADHIAAIDNVTRKLMQNNKRPVTTGLYFSLGHSLVLMIATAAICMTLSSINGRFTSFNDKAGIIGTIVSASFLFIMALINIAIAKSAIATFRHVRKGGAYDENELDLLLNKRGFLSRIFRPLFRLVTESWHLFFVGFLFGFGFDTATEVSLLGIAAAEAARGMPIWVIMVFPVLFAAGMSLMDTTDGILMLGAYGWAFMKPIRKLYYNITVTGVSIVVALLIGGIETVGLISQEFGLKGGLWDRLNYVNGHFGMVGILIIGIFITSWLVSVAIYRLKGYENL